MGAFVLFETDDKTRAWFFACIVESGIELREKSVSKSIMRDSYFLLRIEFSDESSAHKG